MLSEAKVECLAGVDLSSKHYVLQAFPVEQLTEHEGSELIPTGELLDISIAVVFVCQS